MIDKLLPEEPQGDYADKSRIYFIEKYLSTFNANVGKNNFYYFQGRKAFLQNLLTT